MEYVRYTGFVIAISSCFLNFGVDVRRIPLRGKFILCGITSGTYLKISNYYKIYKPGIVRCNSTNVWDPHARVGETPGTYSCLVRTAIGEDILAGAVKKKYIETTGLEASTLATGVGFELKKHAAAFRLRQRRRFGWSASQGD